MSGANASPTGRSHQIMSGMSGANASATARSHQIMDAIIFKDLPATFPEKDKYKKPSVISSVVFHGLLIVTVVILPLLLPQSVADRELLITLVSPIAPPPPPPPPPPASLPAVAVPPRTVEPKVRPVTPETLVSPTIVPREIAKIIEAPIEAPVGVIGGVPGGVPGGYVGGVLSGILASNGAANTADLAPVAPPPPPPPPPKPAVPAKPVRVGGVVQEPRVLAMVPPVYPKLASTARVSGTVVLEATLTEQGTVEEIKVISGHPLLVEAAIAALKQWRYEPTFLNGIPVSVILTAKLHFMRSPLS